MGITSESAWTSSENTPHELTPPASNKSNQQRSQPPTTTPLTTNTCANDRQLVEAVKSGAIVPDSMNEQSFWPFGEQKPQETASAIELKTNGSSGTNNNSRLGIKRQLDGNKKSRSIDSRSIITNKEKLKRFWEKRMELEFKMKQQRRAAPSETEVRSRQPDKLTQQRPSEIAHFTKSHIQQSNVDEYVAYYCDENNNNDNEQPSSRLEYLKATRVDISRGDDGDALDPSIEGQNHDFADNQCKLPRINANDVNISTKTPKPLANIGRSEPSCYLSQQPNDRCTAIRVDSEMPNVEADQRLSHDDIQLMSIDPTLCHSSSASSSSSSSPLAVDSEPQTDKSEEKQNSIECPIDSDEIAKLVCEEPERYEREEQTFDEDFSSSNSSFGPMSISIPTNQTKNTTEPSIEDHETTQLSKAAEASNADDDDQNDSTLSGSVLTVIAQSDRVDSNDSVPTRGSNIEPQTSKSDENELERNQDGETNLHDQIDDENIGVAFESLHFDTEIKSSRHEVVDEDRLIGGRQEPNPSLNGATKQTTATTSQFNSKEVKSVCNYITNAISDATKQVERFMNLNGQINANCKSDQKLEISASNSSIRKNAREEEEDLFGPNGIQRATFVRQDEKANLNGNLRDSQMTIGINEPNQQEEGDNDADDDDDDYDAHEQTRRKFSAAKPCEGSTNSWLKASYDACYRDRHNQDDAEDDDEKSEGSQQRNMPKADLSSVFEANVRREIERFEYNSMLRKPTSNKANTKNGLTEWRIAEEIKLFNEREQELKRRLESCKQTNSTTAPTAVNHSDRNLSHESSNNYAPSSGHNIGSEQQVPVCRSIKLTATCNGDVQSRAANQSQQRQTSSTISMHKFISSGGKRIVYTKSPSSGMSNLLSQQNHLTKSMSSISTASNAGPSVSTPRVVDYKAADSLKYKETPNVVPGLTRKAIETFSRLNDESIRRQNELGSSTAGLNVANVKQSAGGPTASGSATMRQQRNHSASTTSSACSFASCLSPAEKKIQEELREMRAREAELRDMRIFRQNEREQLNGAEIKPTPADRSDNKINNSQITNNKNNGTSREPNDNSECGNERIKTLEPSSAVDFHETMDELNYSSDSLYPIKQAIDSFMKLNLSQKQQQQPQQKHQKPNRFALKNPQRQSSQPSR